MTDTEENLVVNHAWGYKEAKSYYANEPQVKGYVDGYAAALQDLMWKLTGDNSCGKSYDPMWVADGVMHSYAFDMKDGGRHHPLQDYTTIGEICKTLLDEAEEWINYDD